MLYNFHQSQAELTAFLKHVFKNVFNFMCVLYIYIVYISMCTACVCQQWSENGIGSTGNRAMNDCESPDTWGELNLGHLYEQVLLITEQSLHSQ